MKEPIDLRAVQEARARLDRAARDFPELVSPEATGDDNRAEWLTTLEGMDMASSKTEVVRIPVEDGKRAEGLIEALQADPVTRAAAGTVTKSTVLRIAIARGLAALEAEYGKGGPHG